jgi:hypothetical protein
LGVGLCQQIEGKLSEIYLFHGMGNFSAEYSAVFKMVGFVLYGSLDANEIKLIHFEHFVNKQKIGRPPKVLPQTIQPEACCLDWMFVH